jgi:hypothetical protein
MAAERITYAQALALIEEHIGERVSVDVLVAAPEQLGGTFRPMYSVAGVLSYPLDPRPEPEVGYYHLRGNGSFNAFGLYPMAGMIHLREGGIDFRPSEETLVRVAWQAGSEVRDSRPRAEALA